METSCLQLDIPVAGGVAVTNSFHPALLGTDNHNHRTLQHHLMSFFTSSPLLEPAEPPQKPMSFCFFCHHPALN